MKLKAMSILKSITHGLFELPFLSKAQELYSQAEKSGLGTLDMAAVYHYLEKGEH